MNDPHTPPQVQGGYPVSAPSKDDRMWAMIAHLSALSAFVTGFGAILGPLVVWLVKKDTSPFAGSQAKEALNFNITWFAGGAILAGLAVMLSFILIGFLLWPVLFLLSIVWLVLCIIAGVRANEGAEYRYPWTIRFIK